MQVFSPSVLTSLQAFNVSNSGVITLTGAGTDVLALDVGLCLVGQILICSAMITATKGATAGSSQMIIRRQSGPGIALFAGVYQNVGDKAENIGIGNQYVTCLTGVARVTQSGNMVFAVNADSQGSNSNVPIDSLGFQIIRINR